MKCDCALTGAASHRCIGCIEATQVRVYRCL